MVVGGGGWVESIIRLISAKAEAEALLGLAELGNIQQYPTIFNNIATIQGRAK